MWPVANLRLRLGSGIRVRDSQSAWVMGGHGETETKRSFVNSTLALQLWIEGTPLFFLESEESETRV